MTPIKIVLEFSNFKFNYEKETKDLSHSKYIQKLIADLNETSVEDLRLYSICSSIISFSKISAAMTKLSPAVTYLVLMNNGSYFNILADSAALRKYDSSFNSLFMKINGGKLLYIASNLVKESETYIVGLEDDTFFEEEIDFKLNKFRFSVSKDLTKVPVKMKDFIKIVDIVNYL